MSISIPGELEWLGWVAGSDWPDGDEDKMWEIAEAWRTASAQLRDLLPDLAAASNATVAAYPWGAGVDAVRTALKKLEHGDASIERLAEILTQVADSADALGTEIEYTKILVITSIAMLAVEIAAAWLFPPTAPLVEAAAIGLTRVAVRLLGERAVSAIARYAAELGIAAVARFTAKNVVLSTALGVSQDFAIQAGQVAAGHRKDIDWNRIATTAYTAAAAGAIGGPAGGLFAKAAAKVPLPAGAWSGAARGAVVGMSAGMVGALGAWGVGGLANGWTWDPRLLTSGAAMGGLTGGSKGFRHGMSIRHPVSARFPVPEPGRFAAPGSGDGSAPVGQHSAERQDGAEGRAQSGESRHVATERTAGVGEPPRSVVPEPTAGELRPVVAEPTAETGGPRSMVAEPRPGSPKPAAGDFGARFDEVQRNAMAGLDAIETRTNERLDTASRRLHEQADAFERELGLTPETPKNVTAEPKPTAQTAESGPKPEQRMDRSAPRRETAQAADLGQSYTETPPDSHRRIPSQASGAGLPEQTPDQSVRSEIAAPAGGAPSEGTPPDRPTAPDATSQIPYTPRYFGLPPIPEYQAAAAPADTVWQPPLATEPAPRPQPEPESGPKPECEPTTGRRPYDERPPEGRIGHRVSGIRAADGHDQPNSAAAKPNQWPGDGSR
ncbi:hypothetical protein [Nocardia iowensis]|uniref:Outer membrane channel protein CpnT-like N-terminal domain-containing protein n=1 Tax=Nocardia iowensis TaxID=204891 RepID=A0ABX8RTA7_NOCIO|nr:hypothetical protein [Nocardia iowensis]QXN92481.1 hypothetical protein KV110_04840 [Nocardia iowensis]